MMPRLQALADKYEVVGDVRGRGAMIAVELVTEHGSKTPNPALTAAVNGACHRDGLLTLTAGTYGNVLRYLPPLVIGDELLSEGLDILDAAFASSV
jgi:4-aminobutyrate aminotransferase/(S)-3-amino-2-methylpropionate transaminase